MTDIELETALLLLLLAIMAAGAAWAWCYCYREIRDLNAMTRELDERRGGHLD